MIVLLRRCVGALVGIVLISGCVQDQPQPTPYPAPVVASETPQPYPVPATPTITSTIQAMMTEPSAPQVPTPPPNTRPTRTPRL